MLVGQWEADVSQPGEACVSWPLRSLCQKANEQLMSVGPRDPHILAHVPTGIVLASTASPSFWSWISTFWGPALLFIAARVGHWTMRSQKCKCKMVRQITFNTGQFLSRQTQAVWLEAFEYPIFKYLGRGCCTDWEHLNIHCHPDWRH